MKVDFYTANEQLAPTVANYLFSDEYTMIMNGQYIEQAGQWYQVTGQTMPDIKIDPDDPDKFYPLPPHIVFVYPVNRRPIQVLTKLN